jgi:hypothetical protein
MPTYLYGMRGGGPAVLMYTESEAVLQQPGLPAVTLRQETDFPSTGAVTIHVHPERAAEFALHLRIPPYAEGAKVRVGEGEPETVQEGEFAVIEREWQAGDTVKLYLPFTLSCQANDHTLAIVRGPLVYAYFQDAQTDPAVFHRRRGLYPEDAILSIDPARIEESVQEEPAIQGLLGPALRVPGFARSRAPVFATPDGNAPLPGREEQSLLMHPFADQGAIRGVYRVFMEYTKPSARVT